MDFDDGFGAAGDEDRLVELGVDFDHFVAGVFEVLDDPLVAVQFLFAGLFSAHVVWLFVG